MLVFHQHSQIVGDIDSSEKENEPPLENCQPKPPTEVDASVRKLKQVEPPALETLQPGSHSEETDPPVSFLRLHWRNSSKFQNLSCSFHKISYHLHFVHFQLVS